MEALGQIGPFPRVQAHPAQAGEGFVHGVRAVQVDKGAAAVGDDARGDVLQHLRQRHHARHAGEAVIGAEDDAEIRVRCTPLPDPGRQERIGRPQFPEDLVAARSMMMGLLVHAAEVGHDELGAVLQSGVAEGQRVAIRRARFEWFQAPGVLALPRSRAAGPMVDGGHHAAALRRDPERLAQQLPRGGRVSDEAFLRVHEAVRHDAMVFGPATCCDGRVAVEGGGREGRHPLAHPGFTAQFP